MLLWKSADRSPPPLPASGHRRRHSRHIRQCQKGTFTVAFATTAVFCGVVLGALALSVFGSPPPDSFLSPLRRPESQPDHSIGAPPPQPPNSSLETTETTVVPEPPAPKPQRKHDDQSLDIDELKDLIGRTRGYYVRDWSLGLGWNNVRYIIEASLMHAQLLNRTLVLPSFIYARACEYDIAVCADYATMVNKGDAIGWDEWRKLPIEEQMAWKIPITNMLNLTHLRHTHPVILTSEYLRMHNFSEDSEWRNGAWLRVSYHDHANITQSDPKKRPTLHVIENHWFDPKGLNRVDVLPEAVKSRGEWSDDGGDPLKGETGSWGKNVTTTTSRLLFAALPHDRDVLSWDEARSVLETMTPEEDGIQYKSISPLDNGEIPGADEEGDGEIGEGRQGLVRRWDVSKDETLEAVLRLNGWEVLYTFSGALGMDYVKHVAEPIRQVAPRTSLRSLKDDWGHITADVLLLSGEVHLSRKPGALRFTTRAARDNFARLVLQEMRPPDKVLELADKFDERMTAMNGGRMWMAAHMRRGDFSSSGWVMEKTIENHLSRVQDRFAIGFDILRDMRESDIRPYEVPDVAVDRDIIHKQAPLSTDKFYIATDEREPGNLTYLADHGAVLIYDLLTIEDRRAFGWQLMITDIVALVEQATLARAAYFYGHAMSSVAGGVINIRAARGADPRTALID